MYTKILSFYCIIVCFLAGSASAQVEHHHPSLFKAFTLEGDIGGSQHGSVGQWDLDGWIGGDQHRLWLKSEGKWRKNHLHEAEFSILYSRNIDAFWDLQFGVRHEMKPQSWNHIAIGVEGLAPYFIETNVHLFLSEQGDLSLRLQQETELLLTQSLILQPFIEMNVFAQEVPEQRKGAGISDIAFGLQTRYEITRKLAPYVMVDYQRLLGKTASMAPLGDTEGNVSLRSGIRLRF